MKGVWITHLSCGIGAFFLTMGLSFGSEVIKPLEKVQPTTKTEICGSLEIFDGELQVLNESKTHLLEIKPKSSLPCGSWISANEGWAEIKHVAGPSIHLAGDTFIQLRKVDDHSEHVVLYHGQVYVEVNGGDGLFHVGSAGGRVEMDQGKLIYVAGYSKESASQLIVLEGSALFSNRFEGTRNVRVFPGEASELMVKVMRVIPGMPTAVSLAALRPKLIDLRVAEKIQTQVLRVAAQRQERKFAENPQEKIEKTHTEVTLAHQDGKAQESPSERSTVVKNEASPHKQPASRSLASVPSPPVGDIASYRQVRGDHPELNDYWMNQVVPEVKDPETYAFPGRPTEWIDGKLKPRLNARERGQKEKLIDAITRLQAE
jgi:hypothetical protein